MNKNKTQPTQVSVEEFLGTTDPKKKNDSLKLIKIMSKLSGEPPVMWGPSIIGFGNYHYKYASGREGDMARIGFSPRKDKFSLYLSCDSDFAKELLPQLGKYTKSVACIYFKKLDDLDLNVLEKLIKLSLKTTKEEWG